MGCRCSRNNAQEQNEGHLECSIRKVVPLDEDQDINDGGIAGPAGRTPAANQSGKGGHAAELRPPKSSGRLFAALDPEAASPCLAPEVSGTLELVPALQNYAWGQPFESSLVARLCDGPANPLDREKRYAEMWMGTHPNGPSTVKLEASDGAGFSLAGLKETINGDPVFWLGKDAERADLPYLFKVLSIGQALSIQAHPNKRLAEELNKSFPDKYKDSNHKPEICLPLGAFEALVGFRPVDEIRKHIQDNRELQRILGEKLQLSLKDLYVRLMRSDQDLVSRQVDAMVHRLSRREESDLTPEERLVLRLAKDYAGDVGIFSVFFLNYVQVSADQKHRFIFCAPDEPHCYISGDCVECMALSDNVVRAGLTPKFKDVETLLAMMTYRDGLGDLVGSGSPIGTGILKYDPPVNDFVVYELEGGEDGAVPEALELPNASICLCVQGKGSVDFSSTSAAAQVHEVRPGKCHFSRAGTRLCVLYAEPGLRLFIATY